MLAPESLFLLSLVPPVRLQADKQSASFRTSAGSGLIALVNNDGVYLSSLFVSQSFEDEGPSKESDRGRIQKAASAIISALSKRHNSTVMLAVVEVKVETQLESPPMGESHDHLRCLLPRVSAELNANVPHQATWCRFWAWSSAFSGSSASSLASCGPGRGRKNARERRDLMT